ncbi:hypothetical protein AURDEDRAFT_159242 [Auricularia subglabra TFB-10046 SS5]|nr:hypothetical protein AURDEDRAFT_159242 [Auricularia subglabra TFB-10046 SS5]
MVLSAEHDTFGCDRWCIEFLFAQLCCPQSLLGESGTLDVTRLLLERSAIRKIAGVHGYFGYSDDVASHATAILATTINHVGRLLNSAKTISDGEQLFKQSAFSEVNRKTDEPIIWDLGEWIRTQAPDILENCPSSATAMQDIHDTLSGIYPLCADRKELRACWDRIGYPGRPGDIFTYPFLDIGAFFTSAEAPRERPGDIFSTSSLDLADFFDVAEETIDCIQILQRSIHRSTQHVLQNLGQSEEHRP